MVCTGTPEKKKEKRKKKKARRKRNENTQNIWNGKERKRRKQALRAQAESLGDKVAVCWYDQFCDVSIWSTKIRTTQKKVKILQEKEKKEKRKRA